jgi:hypothetical protein
MRVVHALATFTRFRPPAEPPVSAPLKVARLLQNPLGQAAPDGARGDIVRVSDGTVAVYLTPAEFDAASESDLRYLLARRAVAREAGKDGDRQAKP